MRRWLGLAPLAVTLGCSSLDEGEAGIVSLEITTPSPQIIEVGEQLQLSAVPLNADGEVVDVAVTWQVADPTLAVDAATGILTGVSPGTGRVQATAGPLASELISFNVIAGADTLILVGDSVVVLAPGSTASGPLVVQLQSFNPPGALSGRPVVYEITSPAATDPPVVTLSGGAQVANATTEADGAVRSVELIPTPGATAPDTAIVQVRAVRTRGAPVPGSGQRFLLLFP